MTFPPKYFHDRLILLLLSTNVFLAVLSSVVVLLMLGNGKHGTGSFIVQCRNCSNQADINRFMHGGVLSLAAFIGFALIVLVVHVMLSLRVYRIHRQLAVIVLGMGVLLLVLAMIVSYALLVL
jgi:hypothetical protein